MESEEEDFEEISVEEVEQEEQIEQPNLNKINNYNNDIFTPLDEAKLSFEEDDFNLKIYNENKKMQTYLNESLIKFNSRMEMRRLFHI